MKKTILLTLLILCLSGCQKESEKLLVDGYEISPVGSAECSNETPYYIGDERTIYLACYEDINLTKENKKISLSEYLVQNSLDTFTSKLDKETKSTTLKDGGTKIYKSDELTIIVCNKMLDNNKISKDIYIGKDYNKNNDICDVNSTDIVEREK
mgnify:FL=1